MLSGRDQTNPDGCKILNLGVYAYVSRPARKSHSGVSPTNPREPSPACGRVRFETSVTLCYRDIGNSRSINDSSSACGKVGNAKAFSTFPSAGFLVWVELLISLRVVAEQDGAEQR